MLVLVSAMPGLKNSFLTKLRKTNFTINGISSVFKKYLNILMEPLFQYLLCHFFVYPVICCLYLNEILLLSLGNLTILPLLPKASSFL